MPFRAIALDVHPDECAFHPILFAHAATLRWVTARIFHWKVIRSGVLHTSTLTGWGGDRSEAAGTVGAPSTGVSSSGAPRSTGGVSVAGAPSGASVPSLHGDVLSGVLGPFLASPAFE